MQIIKKCENCSREFAANKKTTRYCCKKCYAESKRKRNHEQSMEQKKQAKELRDNSFIPCRHPDCRYHGKGTTATCDYILHTGVPRGCSAANCDKYVPGKQKQKSIVFFDKLTDEERAARAAQYDALNMRLDQYEIQRRHSKERKN